MPHRVRQRRAAVPTMGGTGSGRKKKPQTSAGNAAARANPWSSAPARANPAALLVPPAPLVAGIVLHGGPSEVSMPVPEPVIERREVPVQLVSALPSFPGTSRARSPARSRVRGRGGGDCDEAKACYSQSCISLEQESWARARLPCCRRSTAANRRSRPPPTL